MTRFGSRIGRSQRWLWFVWLCACGGTSAAPAADLHVLSVAPVTPASDALAPIRLAFDKPVVTEREVGQPLATPPINVQPALAVAAHWVDRQTLVAKPLAPLTPATRYTVRLANALAARVPTDEQSYSFVHEPLEVRGVEGLDNAWAPPRPTFSLQLSQPVSGAQVRERCALSTDGGPEPKLVVANAAAATSIEVTVESDLAQGRAYQIECQGLTAEAGNEPLADPFRHTFTVYPTLSVQVFEPGAGTVAPDDLAMKLRFSTPVELRALEEHIHITPDHRGFKGGWVHRGETDFDITVSLEADTRYRIKIDKDLTDRFGQRLAQDRVFEIQTTDALPSLSLERGIYAIEASATGYPVWSRNVNRIDLKCSAVPKGKLVKLLTTDLDYDPWYSAGNEEIHWSELGLRAKEVARPIQHAKNKWHQETFALPDLCGRGGRGVFLAEIRSPDVETVKKDHSGIYPHRVLGNVTDLGVLLKAGEASGLVWVTSIASGEPVGAANVTVYSTDGQRVFAGTTDADGLLRTPGSATLLKRQRDKARASTETDEYDYGYWSYRDQRVIVTVEKDADLAVVDGNWSNGIQVWNFGVPSERSQGVQRIRGLIQSDRGIYRPGETVHFKGIVREITLGKAPSPPSGRVEVKVEDARGSTLFDRALPLSAFGGFAFDLPIDQGAPLGDYYVTAKVQQQTFRESFSVEEFKPVSFEIVDRAAQSDVKVGQRVRFDLEARYLFGAPVKNANVEWSVQRRRRYPQFAAFPQYSFAAYESGESSYDWEEYDTPNQTYITGGEARTDAQGRVRFAFSDKDAPRTGHDYLVQAAVTDATDQRVAKSIVVAAHPSQFYLGLHSQEWLQAVNMPFAINAVAVTPSGAQVATAAKLHLTQNRWDCSWSQGLRASYRCEPNRKHILTRDMSVGASGATVERIVPTEPGEYEVRIEAKDAEGHEVVASTGVWVIGPGEAFWSGDESARMGLKANKSKYEPGEVARLVPQADTRGATLLVTTERDGVMDAFVKRASQDHGAIDVPLNATYAPNVYASIAMVRGRTGEGDRNRPRFRMGVTDLPVSSEHNRLAVAISTEKERYEPGETVRGVIKVASASTPVRAEVSLSVADEGVLQLVAYKTPDPMAKFYESWGLGVDSATNWNRIARIADPSETDAEEGADGPGREQPNVRSRFVSSAYWAPALLTDEQGEARFEFTAPDNLTAFRLMAVAADIGEGFGSSDKRITVARKLLVKPILPRFFTVGDQASIGLVVDNYSGQAGEVVIKAVGRGLSLSQPEQRVTVPDGGSQRVMFAVKVSDQREAKVRFEAKLGALSDGVEVDLPIDRPLVTDRVTLSEGQGASGFGVPLTWAPSALLERSTLDVTVDRLGLAALEPSLRYLVEYPYGCLEQTLSRLIPMFKVRDLASSLKLETFKGGKLDGFIRAGVAKVIRHQHEDGNFSLWPTSEPTPELTVYALRGLLDAEAAGVEVPATVIQRGLDALRRWIGDGSPQVGPHGDAAIVAMAASVLALNERPDAALNTRLFDVHAGLPVYGRAFLLQALVAANAPAAQIDVVKASVLSAVTEKDGVASVQETTDGTRPYWSSNTRTAAIVTSALLLADPRSPLIGRLIEGLKLARSREGRWVNTQENLYGLVAIADYARASAGGSAQITLKLRARVLHNGTISGGEVARISIPLSELAQPSATPMELVLTSSSEVFHRASVSVVRDIGSADVVSQGFTLQRELLDFDTDQPVQRARVGQLLKVVLRVQTPLERGYVALVDHLPAGVELLNDRLATSGDVSSATQGNAWLWTYREAGERGLRVFADTLHAGTHTVSYPARAAIAGTFKAPAATIEQMYEPSVMARTDSQVLVITP